MSANRQLRWLALASLLALPVACSNDTGATTAAAAAPERFACLDFDARVTNGPDAGRSWTGDLVLTADATGAFTGYLVSKEFVDRTTLEVKDTTKANCRAVGQRNGRMISWFLYCEKGERIFGTGQLTTSSPPGIKPDLQEFRGIIGGPADNDFGVYHGQADRPFIRIPPPPPPPRNP